jgi:hypothetical protein
VICGRWQAHTKAIVALALGRTLDLTVPVRAVNSFSDVAGGLVQDSGKSPVDFESFDGVNVLPSHHPRAKRDPKPIGILHLFQTEAAWKPPVQSHEPHVVQKTNLKINKLKHIAQVQRPDTKNIAAGRPRLPVRALDSKRYLPAMIDSPSRPPRIASAIQNRKRNIRKRSKNLSPLTLLRAYENSILIKNNGHLADERELQSLKSTSRGLRWAKTILYFHLLCIVSLPITT